MKGIYVFTNDINGMQYVGKSKRLGTRILTHIKENAEGLLAESIKLHGLSNFSITLYPYPEVSDKELTSIERAKILELNTLVPNGYNKQLPQPEKENFFHDSGIHAGKWDSETRCQFCKKRLKNGEEGLCSKCEPEYWKSYVTCDICGNNEVHINNVVKDTFHTSANFCSEECLSEFGSRNSID